ncbi:MAG TPA: ABC-2 family transporter protein [Anaerolineae bacterium]
MRLFWELVKVAFQQQLSYRATTLAGLATNIFFGLLRVAVLVALYGAQQEVAGLSVTDAITFTGLSQAVIAYLAIFGWYEVMRSVSAGDVAADLLKPMDYYLFWLARDMGRATASFLLRGLTIMAFYALLFEITVPDRAEQWLALVIALMLGLLVSFSYRFLVNLAAFWSPNAQGVGRFAFGLAWTMSGFFMPLRFFPDWFVALCNLTPFPSMVNTIIEIYLGKLVGVALLQALLGQMFWFVLLTAASQVVLRAGVHRLVIQGG